MEDAGPIGRGVMITTMSELRQLIAENCDFSQPLRVVARDLGKKAAKHSVVRADEDHPARMSVTAGLYTKKGVIELAYDSEAEVLTPEAAVAALDNLLEDEPKELIGWVYFFYFPLEYVGLFGRKVQVDCSLLDTSEVRDVYLSEDDPNTLVIEAEYGLGSFD